METERGSFQNRSIGMVDDDLTNEGKGEKWEQTEIVDEDWLILFFLKANLISLLFINLFYRIRNQ